MAVPTTARSGWPAPAAIPIAEVAHRLPAVVSPRIEVPYLMIAPAPRKPMPVTIWAAIRVGSGAVPSPLASTPTNPNTDSTVNIAEPNDTRRWVRIPAGCWWISRSSPTSAPSTEATTSRKARSAWRAEIGGLEHRWAASAADARV